MRNSNVSDGGGHGKFSDFGYTLYRQQSRLIYVPMVVGFVAGISLYGFLPIFDLRSWRIYFMYIPIVVGLGFAGLAVLIGDRVCPPSRQADTKLLTSLNRWRDLDVRNKTRLILGALVAVIGCFMIGWVVGGWAGSRF